MNTKSKLLLIPVLVLALLAAACTPASNSILALDAIADACSAGAILVTALGSTNTIPPALATAVAMYLTDVSQAIPQVAAEVESTDPLATQITKIIAILSPYLTQNIPGLPPAVQALITTVESLIQNFITQLQQANTAVAHTGALTAAPLKLSSSDKRELSSIVKKANATVAMLQPILEKKK